jgi:FkbM family methyltransferase
MNLSSILTKGFERFPEWPVKNEIRYFLAFNPLVPKAISDLSPVKGYELYYQLKPGDVVVDAGAFTGDYTVYASRKVGPTGRVLAFEPDPKTCRILERNLKRERFQNVTIIPKGLWNENTTLTFEVLNSLQSHVAANPAPGAGDPGPRPVPGRSSSNSVQVEVVRLDDELEKLGLSKVDVLKMDIEGAEIQAIEGCEKVLAENNVHVAIAAYHIVNGRTTSFFLEEFLRARGYEAKSDYHKHLTTYASKRM